MQSYAATIWKILTPSTTFPDAETFRLGLTANPFVSGTYGATNCNGSMTCGRIILRCNGNGTSRSKDRSNEKLISASCLIQQLSVMPSRAQQTHRMTEMNAAGSISERTVLSPLVRLDRFASNAILLVSSHIKKHHRAARVWDYAPRGSQGRRPNKCVEEATTKAH